MIIQDEAVVVTGMGVISPVGTGLRDFTTALKEGRSNFSRLKFEQGGSVFHFPAARVDGFDLRGQVKGLEPGDEILNRVQRLRNISMSSWYGIFCALEAWVDAGLGPASCDAGSIAIVSGGSNTQQASLQSVQQDYGCKLKFLNPNYGLNFFDTDLVGTLSELLGIKGEGHSIGAASASGNTAIIQGCRLIAAGDYEVVLVVAPLMDLSVFEYQGFTGLGAMAVLKEDADPGELCRPFDGSHSGFVYGQTAGCLVLESYGHAVRREKSYYGSIPGYAAGMDANRNPNPSVEGEKRVMQQAMVRAGIQPGQVGYVNTHGSSSGIGDKTEAEAILLAGLGGVSANSTKSITGHGLSAAGLVEAIATLIQLREGFLHPSLNLKEAITDRIDWVKGNFRQFSTEYAMSNSFGFGGLNSSIIFKYNSH